MSRARLGARALLVALAPVLVAACGRDDTPGTDTMPSTTASGEAVRVSAVDLGRGVDTNRRIGSGMGTSDFAARDTVYASVQTTGNAAGATLVARWTFQDGQVVDETSRTLSGSGPTNTEFHISMPGGLPAGTYTLEILLNGASVERREFRVAAG